MSGEIHRVLPVGDLNALDPTIAEQNAYYARTSWALYYRGNYTGDWSYDRDYITRLADMDHYRDYAEIAPGDVPADKLTDQRLRMFE